MGLHPIRNAAQPSGHHLGIVPPACIMPHLQRCPHILPHFQYPLPRGSPTRVFWEKHLREGALHIWSVADGSYQGDFHLASRFRFVPFSLVRAAAATYSPPMFSSCHIAHASLVHVDDNRVVVLMHRVQHPLQPTEVHDNLHIPSFCSESSFGFKHLTTSQCNTSQPKAVTQM